MKVITISGHRHLDATSSADAVAWRHLSTLGADISCHWAGTRLELCEPGFRISQRPRGGRVTDLWWTLTTLAAVRRELRSTEDEVVLNAAEPWSWLVAVLVRRRDVRLTLDMHADFTRLPGSSVGRVRAAALRRVALAAARRADAVRVVSPTTCEDLRRRGIASELLPSRLAPLWLDPAERHPPLVGSAIRLVSVGRLIPSKGFDRLLDAVAALQRSSNQVHLTIVGGGPLDQELREHAQRLSLEDAVTFTGPLSAGDVRSVLLDSDVAVLASRDEGTPRTLMEAVAAGLPVVATAVGGIPAAAADLDTVRLCAPDAEAIAHAVADLVAAPPTLAELDAARTQVVATYGFEANLAKVAAFLGITA